MILESPHTRRSFLSGVAIGSGLLTGGCNRAGQPVESPGGATPGGPADVTLRIAPVLVDIAKDHTISTIGYNGEVPGPPIRLKEGVPVTIDLFNDTDTPSWCTGTGRSFPRTVDGAAEEKSLAVPAHGHIRYRLTPRPAGARWVHTHVMPMSDLSRGTYTGQFAFRLHRAQEQSRPVRSGSFSRHPRMGAVPRRGGNGRGR